jgi:transposase-like protein
MNEDYPKNEIEFDRRFCSDEACIDYLFQLRWPEGFVCSKCDHSGYWKSARGLYICSHCEHQQSVTAGTIFHGTRKPLRIWFKALWWFSTRKTSISATTLQDMLGLGSYQTAWSWLQKLRTCTIFPQREKLSGTIEADECYIGGESSGRRGRGADKKFKVAVAVERKGHHLGRLRMQVIENCSAAQLTPFATNNIVAGSNITTDGWKGYSGLEEAGYAHNKTLQAKTNDKDSVLPGVHLIISLVKRVILGTFQGRFDGKYLQRILDEYVFRFNRRTCKSAGKRFLRIIQRAVTSQPVTNKGFILEPIFFGLALTGAE